MSSEAWTWNLINSLILICRRSSSHFYLSTYYCPFSYRSSSLKPPSIKRKDEIKTKALKVGRISACLATSQRRNWKKQPANDNVVRLRLGQIPWEARARAREQCCCTSPLWPSPRLPSRSRFPPLSKVNMGANARCERASGWQTAIVFSLQNGGIISESLAKASERQTGRARRGSLKEMGCSTSRSIGVKGWDSIRMSLGCVIPRPGCMLSLAAAEASPRNLAFDFFSNLALYTQKCIGMRTSAVSIYQNKESWIGIPFACLE